MNLTDFYNVKLVETKRKAMCKNCGVFTGNFKKGEKRIVISNTFENRHLSLCLDCTNHEITLLNELIGKLKQSTKLLKKTIK